jgi:hypothetical protein
MREVHLFSYQSCPAQAYGCEEARFPQDVASVDDANSDETVTPFEKHTGIGHTAVTDD